MFVVVLHHISILNRSELYYAVYIDIDMIFRGRSRVG